jgi:hypothetical protein
MEGPACATCPWWVRLPDRLEYRWSSEQGEQVEIRTPNDRGECRRFPPRPPRDFPHTDPGDWCAEHPERRMDGRTD